MSTLPEHSQSAEDRPRSGQPSLWLSTASVGVYIALAAVAIQNHPRVLDVLMDSLGLFAAVWGFLAIGGLLSMANPISHGGVGRTWTIALLLAGVLYAAVNVGYFVVALATDEFDIFDRAYAIRVLAGAALMMIASVLAASATRRFDRLGVLGFVLWIASVGLAHLLVVAAASASV